jgi:hypothetical protein
MNARKNKFLFYFLFFNKNKNSNLFCITEQTLKKKDMEPEEVQMALNTKFDLKPLQPIDFALRFIFFICLKLLFHFFTNLDAKSIDERDFESKFIGSKLLFHLFIVFLFS